MKYMQNISIITIVAVGLLVISSAFAQGPLIPPGAPAPTMKTLQQIEPRTAITNLPYTISQSGSYYLAGNYTSSTTAITISADHVTLDLLGHTLTGPGAAGSTGILIAGATNAPRSNITIRNGGLRLFNRGIQLTSANNCRIEDIRVFNSANTGIVLWGENGHACNGNTFVRCRIGHGGFHGIWVYSSNGNNRNNEFIDCTIYGNSQRGILIDARNGGRAEGNRIVDCRVYGNASYGISLLALTSGNCDGNTMVRTTVHGNANYGIYLSASEGGTCSGNLIADCLVSDNVDYGIQINGANRNRIENNHITRNTGVASYGIRTIGSSGNLIVRNSSMEHVNPYSFSANDMWGPIVNTTGALSDTGIQSHPWANFAASAP